MLQSIDAFRKMQLKTIFIYSTMSAFVPSERPQMQ